MMNHSRNRRRLLLAAVSVPIAAVWTSWATQGNATVSAQARQLVSNDSYLETH